MADRRISDDDRQRILAAYVAGESGRRIGDRFNVGRGYATELAKKHGIPRPVREKMPKGSAYRSYCNCSLNVVAALQIDPEMASLRDERQESYYARDLTATLLGDPPVGFSALDEHRAASAKKRR